MSEPCYDAATAGKLKSEIENRLKNGVSFDSEELVELKEIYLEVERGIYRVNHPIDSDCSHIPPWERLPNQIVRDVEDRERFTLDESGLAQRFSEEVKGWLVWNVNESKWYVWENNHWKEDKDNLVVLKASELVSKQLAYESPEYMKVILSHDKSSTVKISIDKKLVMLQENAARIHTRDMIIKASRALNYHVFDAAKEIPFKNGLFDVETGEFRPHSPENYNTTVGNVDLDLQAPPFEPGEVFLNEISCNDSEWVHSLLRVIGEMLCWGNKHQIIVVFYGVGNNGKGVFVDWLFNALGELIGDCAPIELSRNNKAGRQTSIHDNIGKRRIIVFKESGGILFDDDVIKRMTGEERAIWTRINTGEREIEHVATPLLITNNLPTVETGGESMVRRQLGIPFELKIDAGKRDENLKDKLITPEGNVWLVSQIINTLLNDKKAGKNNLKASMCDRISKFTEHLIEESDIVYLFIQDCIEITNSDEDRVSRNALYSSFCGFAYSPTGINPTERKYWITPKKFQERLAGYRIRASETNTRLTASSNPMRNIYIGIKLTDAGVTWGSFGIR